jgi:hypothetical protein
VRQLFDQKTGGAKEQYCQGYENQHDFYARNGKIRAKGAYNIKQTGREQGAVFQYSHAFFSLFM